MKRSYFKQKSRQPLKRTKLKRKSKSPIVKVQDELWEICKQIIRTKYGNTCFTCDRSGLAGSQWHTGHFIPKSVCGAYLKYDLRNLRPQCYRCNIDLSGNGSEFYRRMVIKEGATFVDELFKDKQKTVKAIDHYKMTLLFYRENYVDLIK